MGDGGGGVVSGFRIADEAVGHADGGTHTIGELEYAAAIIGRVVGQRRSIKHHGANTVNGAAQSGSVRVANGLAVNNVYAFQIKGTFIVNGATASCAILTRIGHAARQGEIA